MNCSISSAPSPSKRDSTATVSVSTKRDASSTAAMSFARTSMAVLVSMVLIGCLLLLQQTASTAPKASDSCTASPCAGPSSSSLEDRTAQSSFPIITIEGAQHEHAQAAQSPVSFARSGQKTEGSSAVSPTAQAFSLSSPSGALVTLNHSAPVRSPCNASEHADARRIVAEFEQRDFVRRGTAQRLKATFLSEEGAKIWRAYACVTHHFQDMYGGLPVPMLWAMRAPKHSPHPFFWPLHTTHSPRDVLHVAAFIGRLLKVPLSRTLFKNLNMTDHNTAIETAQLSDLNPLQTFDERSEPTPKSVLELGCGMGGYLGLLCPPPPAPTAATSMNGGQRNNEMNEKQITEDPKRNAAANAPANRGSGNSMNPRCAGADITTKLITNAKLSFPHIDLWRAFGAPHIATGTIDAAFTHGVMYALQREKSCSHLTELLRVLKPGSGILVSDSMARFGFGARFSPTFFSDEPFFAEYDIFSASRVEHDRYQRSLKKPPVFMRGCPALTPFVRRVDFIRGIKTNIKTLRELYNDHSYGVRIFRSDKSMAHIAPLKVMKNGKAPFNETKVTVTPEQRRSPFNAAAMTPYSAAVRRASELVWRDLGSNQWFAEGETKRKKRKR